MLVYTVRQSHAVIIERFGKFSRVQNQGICFKLPLIEKIRPLPEWGGTAVKNNYLIELTEQHNDTPPRQCHTKDNVAITANASVYWRIIDPVKAVYEVDVLPIAVTDIALNSLRSVIGTMGLDEVLSNRLTVNERVSSELHKTANKWGVQFTKVEIQEITTSDVTAKAMQQEMEAERKKRAMVAEAEGEYAKRTKEAEADKKASVLRAEGEAEALKMITGAESEYLEKLKEKVGNEIAGQLLIAEKYLKAMDKITQNKADKVFLPNSFHGLFTLPLDRK